jgi:hypothetical protein
MLTLRGEPSDFSIIEKDVPQWVTFLTEYKDVIFVLQAGWLGKAYGEWWGTDSTPDHDIVDNSTVSYRKRFIVDQLLNVPEVPVSMRNVRDIANYYDGHERVGFHDDCILAEGYAGNDMGTFDKASTFFFLLITYR